MRRNLLRFGLIFVIFHNNFISHLNGAFSNHFRAFLHNRFGQEMVGQLERRDLGDDASVGGLEDGAQQVPVPTSGNDPVIIVHGITNKITRFAGIIHLLRMRGHSSAEVFGTTWGDGGATPVGLVEMKCAYIKQIRSMIVAVREYTGKKVDIIAYSMGSPMARKAILGGLCMDTREVLGPPLTEHIDTFLSVAGANYGSTLCLVPLPLGTCNRKNGLHCESEFLVDVNGHSGYEGSYIFSIFSSGDEKIGFRACGRLTSPIVGETGYVKREGLSHDAVMDSTGEMQFNFITKHRPK